MNEGVHNRSCCRGRRPPPPPPPLLLLDLLELLLLLHVCSLGFALCNRSSPDEASSENVNMSKGVVKEVLVAAPAGARKPKKGQKVTVHCTGYGKNGDLSQKFWSTKDAGQVPFSYNIGLGNVIKGWDEGVMDMGVGEVAKLTCSPEYGYGAGGFEAWGIMPNSTLCFEIEVLSIERRFFGR